MDGGAERQRETERDRETERQRRILVAGRWRGGAGSGSISFILPVGYNKGRLHVGMSYNNPACHGSVTVGGETIFDETFLVDDDYVEFDCEWMPAQQPNKTRTN